MLTIYTIDGYIKALVFNGICDRDIFKGFIINQVLPLYNLYLNP